MIKNIKLQFNNPLFAELPLLPDEGSGIKNILSVKAHISLKKAGDMYCGNTDNRKKYFEMLKIDYERVSGINQVHSKDIKIVESKKLGQDIPGDGLITGNRNAVLSVTVADCIPLCLYDKKSNAFGVLHSGWRGTGIAGNAIELFCNNFNSKPEDIYVTIGPGIGSCCYNVSENLYVQFKNQYGSDVVSKKENKYYIDLKRANIKILTRYDIKNITLIEDCTFCNKLLSSYRRDGEDKFKRMAVSISSF